MFYGYKDLYKNDEFLNRIYVALNEKIEKTAYFSIHCPLYNKDNAMKSHGILTDIISRIIEDSSDYLKTITEEKSTEGIDNFLNNLMDRRKLEVEEFVRNKSSNSTITPLQQKENELSSLEGEAERITNVEVLIEKQSQQEGRDIGE